jgi:hypothetical protein
LRYHISIFLERLSKATKIMLESTVCKVTFRSWNLQNAEELCQLDRDILQWLSEKVIIIFKVSQIILLKTGVIHLVKNNEYVVESAFLEYAVSLGRWSQYFN